jgi:hypothetical protein
MTTANEIINQAAEKIGARSLAKPLNSASIARMFTILLQVIAKFERDNLQLGLTVPASVTDDLLEPEASTVGIVNELGLKSAAPLRLSRNLTPDFKVEAAESKEDLFIFFGSRPQQQYPDNLPLGKGNNTGPRGHRYWPTPNNIDTENGTPITLEP